ncbi:MAG: TRAP transporter small permease [Chloroflexota bacterium]
MGRLVGLGEKAFVLGSLGVMTAATLYEVVHRYWLRGSVPWTDELSRLLLVWMIFLGAALVTRVGGHIRVDLVSLIVKNQRAVFIWETVLEALGLVFTGILLWWTIPYAWFAYTPWQESPTTGMPLLIPKAAMVVGPILMGIFFLQNLVRRMKRLRGWTGASRE